MSKLRGLEKDDGDVRYSKTLAYLLRHGAEKQGLPMRQDGYVRVVDILDEPNLKDLSFPHLYHLVETNNKKRFVLFYGFDPSPFRPQRKRKQQGQTKKVSKQQQDRDQHEVVEVGTTSSPKDFETSAELPLEPVEAPHVATYNPQDVTQHSKQQPAARSSALGSNAFEPEWFIRAAQGHSIQSVTTDHLVPITTADDDGLSKVGEMVHGTKAVLWDSIFEKGLSKGTRQHIHLARARSGAISGPRANSTLYIYISLANLLSQDPPIPVFLSSNNVVLTPGNSRGIIPKELFSRVIRLRADIPHSAAENAADIGDSSHRREDVAKTIDGKPGKRDRKQRERPRFVEEVIWEDGKPVDPPRLLEPEPSVSHDSHEP